MEVGVGVVDQKTSDRGASVAECTKDTEQTEATAGELCTQDGEGQDRYEVEIIYEGQDEEVTLRDHYKLCRKSARHSEYIPVHDFCMDHLPLQYRTERVLALVKALVKLTVLLKVYGTNDKRAEYFPGTAKEAFLLGSGRVVEVREYTNECWKDINCPCGECQTSGKPKQSYAKITVRTAAHVVFDLTEARKTVCYFDFDNESTVLSACPTLGTAVHVLGHAEKDVTRVTFVTHDLQLTRRLEETVKTFERLWDEIQHEYGIKNLYDDNEENLLDNISLFYRGYQEVMEKYSERIERWRNMTIAEAESKLNQIKNEYKIQSWDKLPHYGKILKERISDGDEWRSRLTAVSRRYEACRRCMTCIRDLEKNFQSYIQLHGVQWVVDKYREYRYSLESTAEELACDTGDGIIDFVDLFYYRPSHSLAVIVAHPHGFRKQISIGQVTKRSRDMKDYDVASYIYTATTCPGSSGGPVYILGRAKDRGIFQTCPHSKSSFSIDLNKSGVVEDDW